MAKKVVKSRVEKTRNHFTMTESAFWGMIRATLRSKSRFWIPIQAVKKLARRPVKNKGLQKWEYKCAECSGWFMEKEVAVDHVVSCGTLTCGKDIEGFIERLFVEATGNKLQVLCNKRLDGVISCHKKKTDAYMQEKKLKK